MVTDKNRSILCTNKKCILKATCIQSTPCFYTILQDNIKQSNTASSYIIIITILNNNKFITCYNYSKLICK